jgi:hypothetical protein
VIAIEQLPYFRIAQIGHLTNEIVGNLPHRSDVLGTVPSYDLLQRHVRNRRHRRKYLASTLDPQLTPVFSSLPSAKLKVESLLPCHGPLSLRLFTNLQRHSLPFTLDL